MSRYCGIDLHATNSYVAVIDEENEPILSRRLPNDLLRILEALEPYREELVLVNLCLFTATLGRHLVLELGGEPLGESGPAPDRFPNGPRLRRLFRYHRGSRMGHLRPDGGAPQAEVRTKGRKVVPEMY